MRMLTCGIDHLYHCCNGDEKGPSTLTIFSVRRRLWKKTFLALWPFRISWRDFAVRYSIPVVGDGGIAFYDPSRVHTDPFTTILTWPEDLASKVTPP